MNLQSNHIISSFLLIIHLSFVINEAIKEIIAIPFQKHNDMPYVAMIVNNKNRTLSISTCLYQSALYKGQSSALDKKEESSNVYYDTYHSGPNIRVSLSFDYISNNHQSSIDITDYEFILLVRKSNETIFARQPEHYAGVLALPRRSLYYHDSLLKKLYLKKHINTIAFGFNYEQKYLAIGSKDTIMSTFPINNREEMKTSCMLYRLDNVLYSQWACKATYIIIGEDYFNYSSDKFISAQLNVLFEPMINNIVIPKKFRDNILNKLFSIGGELFNKDCKLIPQTHHDETYYQNRIDEFNLKLFYIKCITPSVSSINDFISLMQINTFNIVINGFVYSFKANELFMQNYTDTNTFYSSILFSETNKHYAILGNIFLNKLKGIIYDDESDNIFFINNSPPVNIQSFTRDEPEKRSAQFFLFTVICVILLIIIALLIPYYFYKKNKRKMMDRLNYEIIYKKVDEIRKSLLHLGNEHN